MPTVNTHPVEPGCYIAGHWGQYGPDRLADIAEDFGWEPGKWSDDPRAIRDVIDTLELWGHDDAVPSLWELHVDAADDIETWLNDRTPGHHYWMWHDGEFYLSGMDENGDPQWD